MGAVGTDTQDSRDGFPLVEVSGTSYEMGYQHGTQAAGEPRELLAANALSFVPAIEALSPSFLEEVRGLADGAGISFEEAVLCQARAEAVAV